MFVETVAFSRDGRRLASAGWDRSVKVWDVATGQEIRTLLGHTSNVYGVAFSPDGRLLATAGLDGAVRLWDVGTHRPIGTPLTGHTDHVLAVDFSPDGTLLASASFDGTVRLWDPHTGQPIGRPLAGRARNVLEVAFSPDGTRLAGDLMIISVADEEEASTGMAEVLRHHTADAAVVTEPTELAMVVAHKGFCWMEVETEGLAAHGSRWQEGIDANLRMGASWPGWRRLAPAPCGSTWRTPPA